VQAAPGGGSSLDYLFSGSKDGKWCPHAVSSTMSLEERFLLNQKKKNFIPMSNYQTAHGMYVACMCVHAFVCVLYADQQLLVLRADLYHCRWNWASRLCWHYREWCFDV
jgi:hypothetical protein